MPEAKKEVVTSASYTLLIPVKRDGGETVAALNMRELSVNEMIELERAAGEKGMIEYDAAYFAKVCGVPGEVIGALGSRDWRRMKDKYQATLGNVDIESETPE